ncbi:MAG TPA: branched-chain amino acid ABC transporter permease [Xanthobacteraceae bacterium]|jgi:branched-chain amino acid transport system permease protein
MTWTGQARSIAAFLLLALGASLIPLVTEDFYKLEVATTTLQDLILAMSLRVVMNLGLLNLAHVSLMGIGAYVSAALAMRSGTSFWLTLPIAAGTSAVMALALGMLTLRLHGPYFFLVTFAVMSMIQLFFHSYLEDIFGGATGLIGVPRPDPIGLGSLTLPLASKVSLYYLILTFWIVAATVLFRLEYSRLGLQCAAIKQSEAVARAVGIHTIRCKLLVLTLSGFLAGAAGVFFAHSRGVINSSDFGIDPMLKLLVYVVVGGVSNVWGPVVGTIGFSIVSELLRGFHFLETLMYGAVLIAVMRLFPEGITGALERIFAAPRPIAVPSHAAAGA